MVCGQESDPFAVEEAGKKEKEEVHEASGYTLTFDRFITPASPTSFETKNVGETVEVEFQTAGEGEVDLRLSASHVRDLRRHSIGRGMAEWQMPEFAVSALKTGVILPAGKATSVGTVNRAEQTGEARWVFMTFSNQR